MNSQFAISDVQQRYADAVESALDILILLEDDEDECLSEDSVIDDLTDNYSYSLAEAQSIFDTACAIHEYRNLSGFYN
jgi:hypothetical protein